MTDKEIIRAVCVSIPKFEYVKYADGTKEFYIGKLKIADVYDSVGESPVYDYKIMFCNISKNVKTVGQGLRTDDSKREVHRMLLAYWTDFMLEIYTDTFQNK